MDQATLAVVLAVAVPTVVGMMTLIGGYFSLKRKANGGEVATINREVADLKVEVAELRVRLENCEEDRADLREELARLRG